MGFSATPRLCVKKLIAHARGDACGVHGVLYLGDGEIAGVNHAGNDRGVGTGLLENLNKMFRTSCAA